jgi:hypothetical protein
MRFISAILFLFGTVILGGLAMLHPQLAEDIFSFRGIGIGAWAELVTMWWVALLSLPVVLGRGRKIGTVIGLAVSGGLFVGGTLWFHSEKTADLAAFRLVDAPEFAGFAGPRPGFVEIRDLSLDQAGEAACNAVCAHLFASGAQAVRMIWSDRPGDRALFLRKPASHCDSLDPGKSHARPCIVVTVDGGGPADLVVTVRRQAGPVERTGFAALAETTLITMTNPRTDIVVFRSAGQRWWEVPGLIPIGPDPLQRREATYEYQSIKIWRETTSGIRDLTTALRFVGLVDPLPPRPDYCADRPAYCPVEPAPRVDSAALSLSILQIFPGQVPESLALHVFRWAGFGVRDRQPTAADRAIVPLLAGRGDLLESARTMLARDLPALFPPTD